MTYYAGVDVSLRSANVCVINDDGEPLTAGDPRPVQGLGCQVAMTD
jgi:hypothetical protein